MRLKRIWVLFAVLWLFFGCHPKKTITVPSHLVGLWNTKAPRFADRVLKFTKDSIIFQFGKNQGEIHSIKKIKEARKGRLISYKITYKEREGGESKISFTYVPTNKGEIRIKHQRNVTWMKGISN